MHVDKGDRAAPTALRSADQHWRRSGSWLPLDRRSSCHPPATVVIRKNSERPRITVISRATVSGLRARSTTPSGCPPAATCRNTDLPSKHRSHRRPAYPARATPPPPASAGTEPTETSVACQFNGPAKSSEWCRRPALQASCIAASTVSCPNRRWFYAAGCRENHHRSIQTKRRSMQFLIWFSIASTVPCASMTSNRSGSLDAIRGIRPGCDDAYRYPYFHSGSAAAGRSTSKSSPPEYRAAVSDRHFADGQTLYLANDGDIHALTIALIGNRGSENRSHKTQSPRCNAGSTVSEVDRRPAINSRVSVTHPTCRQIPRPKPAISSAPESRPAHGSRGGISVRSRKPASRLTWWAFRPLRPLRR